MCLANEFFIKRNDIYKEYSIKGRMDLNQFLDNFSLSENHLVSSGLFKLREFKSTAELYDIELTQEGKKYFIYNTYELFFIKAKVDPRDVYQFILKECTN